MTDIATITRNAHNTGFERGSHVTLLQTVMAYLDSCGGSAFAAAISTASADGTLEMFRPDLQAATPLSEPKVIADPVKPTDLAPPKITREQATQSGFTGNTCATCGSMMMVRNGTCEKCTSCGTTTGCS
jgi:hypothetical protein